MRIYSMQASFGCLEGRTLTLPDEFTLISAPNESGKSTWCAFLVAMLYGINTRERDKKGVPAEKNRFRPWNGAPLEGMLDCDYQGERVHIRRSSAGGTPFGKFSAVFAESGQAVPGMTGENAGEILTGVGRELFERSVLFRQSSLQVDQSHELEQRIAALLSSGEEQVSWSKADARLREWQRSRRYHKSGALPLLEEDERQLTRRMEQLHALWNERNVLAQDLVGAEQRLDEICQRDKASHQEHRDELERRWAESAAELDAAQLSLQSFLEAEQAEPDDAADAAREELQIRKKRRTKGLNLSSLCALLLCLPLLFLLRTDAPQLLLIAGLSLLLTAAVVIQYLRVSQNKRDAVFLARLEAEQTAQQDNWVQREQAKDAARARESAARQLYVALSRDLQSSAQRSEEQIEAESFVAEMKQTLARLNGRLEELGDLHQLEAVLEENRRQQASLQQEFQALEMAVSSLATADRSMRARFSPELNARAAAYFSRLTGGAYETVLFARDFSAQTEQPGNAALRNALFLSQGTLDQLYFSLRLAICDLVLPEENKLPLILDDALCSFDDHRAKIALELLQELSHKRQIIFFSCQERERQLLAELPVHP